MQTCASLALAAFAQQPAAGEPDTKRVILAAGTMNTLSVANAHVANPKRSSVSAS
jgi:hypothetical protein